MEDEKLLLNVQDDDVTVPSSRCRVRPSPAVVVLLSLLALFNFICLIVVYSSGNPLLWGDVQEIWWLVLVDCVSGLFLSSFLLFWALVKLAHFVGVRFQTFHVVALVLDFFHYPLASLSGSIGIVFVFRLIVVKSDVDSQLGYTFSSLVAISIILLLKATCRTVIAAFAYQHEIRLVFRSTRIEKAVLKMGRLTGLEDQLARKLNNYSLETFFVPNWLDSFEVLKSKVPQSEMDLASNLPFNKLASQLGTRLFRVLGLSSPEEPSRFVTRGELIRALWMSEARLALPERWFAQIDLNGGAYCQADDVAVFVDAFYRERKLLVRRLEGRFALVSVTNTLLTVVGFVLAAIVVLAIWQIPSSVYLIPIGSAVLGLSFAFGKSAQDLVYSLYLVFSVAPYEIGDWVSLDNGEIMTVQKVNLMTTAFRGIPEGRMVYMSNAEIYISKISNWSRTKKMQLEVRFAADPRVTLEDVQYVREQLRLFVAEHGGQVADSFLCHVTNSQQIEGGQVNFLVRVRLRNHVRYPNTDVWRPINTALTVRLMEALRRRDVNSKILAGYEDPRYKDDPKAKFE